MILAYRHLANLSDIFVICLYWVLLQVEVLLYKGCPLFFYSSYKYTYHPFTG